METTEKITVNLTPVDLGQMDLLVEGGFYSNRTDFIRAAIRRQLDSHQDVVRKAILARNYTLGVLTLTRRSLEQDAATGDRVRYFVVGMAVIESDVYPDLADRTIESLTVKGVLRAPAAVRERLGDRVRA